MQTRTVLQIHPRFAPFKAAVFPLVKKDGMPEVAMELYWRLEAKIPRYFTTRKGLLAAVIADRMKWEHRTGSPSTARERLRQSRHHSRSRFAGTSPPQD
jgi:hypothetical protein